VTYQPTETGTLIKHGDVFREMERIFVVALVAAYGFAVMVDASRYHGATRISYSCKTDTGTCSTRTAK